MAYLKLFQDAACEVPFAAIPSVRIEPTWYQANPQRRLINGKEYLCMNNVFITAPFNPAGLNPPFTSNRDRWHSGKWFYTESHLRFTITETNVIGANCAVGDVYAGSTQLTSSGSGSQVQQDTYCAWYFFEFEKDGITYYMIPSFIRFPRQDTTIYCMFAAEKSFWESDFRQPYSYGEKPDDAGGQGSGTIPDTGVHRSANPSAGIPLGGRGLHAYVATPAGYRSLQEYLWGEGNTLAKSLWQKFLNKTHNPSSCVVACFRLPTIFMPTVGTASGVQIAGINLPTTGTMSVDLGYKPATISLGTLEPPFGSWLDYCGVTCKIYIPFCGEIAVDAAQIFNREIKIEYRCDTFNGNLGATVFAGNHQIADLTTNVAYPIPVSGGDTGTLDRIGALATGALAIAAAESGGAAMAAIAGAAGGFAGSQYKTYLNNSNTSGSVNSCINGVAYVEYIAPTTAYPYQDSPAYLKAYGLPAPAFAGQLSEFAGGYGEFDVQKNAGDTISILGASDEEKAEIIRLLGEGVVV